MNGPKTARESGKNSSSTRKLARRILTLVVAIGVVASLLFGIARRLDWIAAWIVIGFAVVFLGGILTWGTRHAPELLDERTRIAANVKRWDIIITTIYRVLLVCLLVTASIDAGRLRWSKMPVPLSVVGAAIIFAGAGVIWWCMKSNPFLSSSARIQDDRCQTVVHTGPYQYVRHPMYITLIALMPSLALLLGSWWALLPAALMDILFVVRTYLEDGMLAGELQGYRQYSARVRYRLVPGIW